MFPSFELILVNPGPDSSLFEVTSLKPTVFYFANLPLTKRKVQSKKKKL